MAKALFPDARFRSPTAVKGRSDLRDEYVYSSLVLTTAATGQAKIFTVPQGQTIPKLGTTAAAAHQTTYTALTTNLSKAGEFGSALGDASVRAIGMTIERAKVLVAATYGTYGASPGNVEEILSKSAFALRVGGKKQVEAPVFAFPAVGGVTGAMASTGTNATPLTSGFLNNGIPSQGRKLKIPIMIGRTDTVEGEFTITGAYTFAEDLPALCWVSLLTLIKGDVR